MPPQTRDTSQPWRVAILGLGHWYSAFGLARALREYPRATLVGAAWHDPRAARGIHRHVRRRGHDGHAALLARDDVDIVQIAAPVSEHRRADHSSRSRRQASHCRQAPGDDDRRSRPHGRRRRRGRRDVVPMQALMRLRGARPSGPHRAGANRGSRACCTRRARWSIAEDWYRSGRPGWFADPRHVPGGAFIDEGIYWIDFFRWLTGSEIVDVDARMANFVHRDIEVEDWGQAFFTLANGVRRPRSRPRGRSRRRARPGPRPKQNSVVRFEAVGTRGEMVDQWFRAPGLAVLAAGAEDWVFERQSEDAFSIQAPALLDHLIDCLEDRAVAHRDAARCAPVVRGGPGRVSIGTRGTQGRCARVGGRFGLVFGLWSWSGPIIGHGSRLRGTERDCPDSSERAGER